MKEQSEQIIEATEEMPAPYIQCGIPILKYLYRDGAETRQAIDRSTFVHLFTYGGKFKLKPWDSPKYWFLRRETVAKLKAPLKVKISKGFTEAYDYLILADVLADITNNLGDGQARKDKFERRIADRCALFAFINMLGYELRQLDQARDPNAN